MNYEDRIAYRNDIRRFLMDAGSIVAKATKEANVTWSTSVESRRDFAQLEAFHEQLMNLVGDAEDLMHGPTEGYPTEGY